MSYLVPANKSHGHAGTLYDWRMDPECQMQSFTEVIDDPLDFYEFYKQRYFKDGCRAWFVGDDGPFDSFLDTYRSTTLVAFVCLDTLEDAEVISVVVDPINRGIGIGKESIRLATANARGRVVAKIKPGNTASIKAFERTGFKVQEFVMAEWTPEMTDDNKGS